MTDFVVTITDPDQLAGITWAREKYNAALPPPEMTMPPPAEEGAMSQGERAPEPQGMVVRPSSVQATIDSDEAYVQWIMDQAATSYAVQQEQEAWRSAYEEAQSAGSARTPTPPVRGR